VWAAAGLDPGNPVGCEYLATNKILLVFPGVDIIGNNPQFVSSSQPTTKSLDERCLTGAYRAADPDAQGCILGRNHFFSLQTLKLKKLPFIFSS
jgi:hypothetical protein